VPVSKCDALIDEFGEHRSVVSSTLHETKIDILSNFFSLTAYRTKLIAWHVPTT